MSGRYPSVYTLRDDGWYDVCEVGKCHDSARVIIWDNDTEKWVWRCYFHGSYKAADEQAYLDEWISLTPDEVSDGY